MSSLQLFNFENHEIRAISIDGKPALVAVDLMPILEFSDRTLRRRVSELDEDEYTYVDPSLFLSSEPSAKNCTSLPSENNDVFLSPESSDKNGSLLLSENNRRKSETRLLVIFQSGIYDLIYGSKAECAKPFKRKVRKEILPAIDKTGAYVDRARFSDEEFGKIQETLTQRDQRIEQLEQAIASVPVLQAADTTKSAIQAIAMVEDSRESIGQWCSQNANNSSVYSRFTNYCSDLVELLERGLTPSIGLKYLEMAIAVHDQTKYSGKLYPHASVGHWKALEQQTIEQHQDLYRAD